jgi:hypothetical protein
VLLEEGDCMAQVAGYAGLLLATPTVLYEIVAYVVPGLTKSERDLLAPIVFGSSILFYVGCVLSSNAACTIEASCIPSSHCTSCAENHFLK